MTMLSARLYHVVGHALDQLDRAAQVSGEPYVAFEGTLTTADLNGNVLDLAVEHEDGKHFAAVLD